MFKMLSTGSLGIMGPFCLEMKSVEAASDFAHYGNFTSTKFELCIRNK